MIEFVIKMQKLGQVETELSNEEEEVLVDYCLLMAKSSHLFTVLLIKALAWSTVKKKD